MGKTPRRTRRDCAGRRRQVITWEDYVVVEAATGSSSSGWGARGGEWARRRTQPWWLGDANTFGEARRPQHAAAGSVAVSQCQGQVAVFVSTGEQQEGRTEENYRGREAHSDQNGDACSEDGKTSTSHHCTERGDGEWGAETEHCCQHSIRPVRGEVRSRRGWYCTSG